MKCIGCGIKTKDIDGPVHEYMTSSSGCWQTYGQILDKEYSKPEYMKVHRLTVDAYACQHIGGDDPRAVQSVNVHLLALYLALEENLEFSKIPQIMAKVILRYKGDFPNLEAPNFESTLKVTDVLSANSSAEHCQLVRKWAAQVWQAWKTEHKRIKILASAVLGEN